MMIRKVLRASTAAAVLFVAGCTADEALERSSALVHSGVPVSFSVSERLSGTRASTSIVSFDANEDVKVMVKPAGADSYTGYTYTTASAGQTGVVLTPPETPPYFPAGVNTTVEAYAYYPATATAAFTVAADQTTSAGYKASDLMYADNRTITKDVDDGNSHLAMRHLMAQLHLTVTATNLTVNRVLVEAKQSATFDAANGIATATGAAGTILASTSGGDAYVCIPPQAMNGVTVKVETGAANDAATTATFALAATGNFEAGNSYPYTLQVTAAQLGTTTAIVDWEEQAHPQCLTFNVGGAIFNMIYVKGGDYVQHWTRYNEYDVTVSGTLTSYYIGQTEVTQALWQAVMGSNPSNWKEATRPVETVSWNMICQENGFLDRLNAAVASQLAAYGLSGCDFQLPSEAQWQYAAMGGVKSQGYTYAGGNDLNTVAWNSGNASSQTHPVACKQANELGLYDMTGNVWEWCRDWYCSSSTIVTSQGTNYCRTTQGDSSKRVIRGAGHSNGSDWCPVSRRLDETPSNIAHDTGFRLALELP